MNENKMKGYIKQAIIIVVSIMVGSVITMFIKDTNCTDSKINLSGNSHSEFEPLYEAYESILKNYYDKVDSDKLIEGALNGMMESLGDEHSIYFDKESKEAFNQELSGSYYGIGAEIQLNSDQTISIRKIFDDSPAYKAGLKANDVIISVDGESVKGKSASDVATMIKKGKNKIAVIIIKRDGKEETYKIAKENVTLYSVSSEMLNVNNKKIGYIGVSIFGEKTYSQFSSALSKLENENMESLIIDLRGNSGGYLTTVTRMLNIFIEKGNVIYQMQTQDGVMKYKTTLSGHKSYNIVVLVDENSASASEIMASAMQEVYGAKLVGKTTYGKGTVQTTSDLSNGAMIKYTIEKWLTANGNSIDKVGVKPDYEVSLSEKYSESPSNENDDQLQKAIELLK